VIFHSSPNFLLASPEPALLSTLEPLLAARGGKVNIALTAEAALSHLAATFTCSLFLLDAQLPGMEIGQLLASAQVVAGARRLSIVLISDTTPPEMLDRLSEGVLADIVPRNMGRQFWRVRVDGALRNHRDAVELDQLREATSLSVQYDQLTGAYNRETLLAMLFREIDRVQRMKSSLGLILFDIDDFGHWNSRLGGAECDELLCQVVQHTSHLLRSYDLLGRVGKDEFLVAMPGCTSVNASALAERLRVEVFGEPCRAGGEAVRLSACFGISSSNGRSPLVVLREAEQALAKARIAGPESIRCFGECAELDAQPVTFFSPSSGDELLAW